MTARGTMRSASSNRRISPAPKRRPDASSNSDHRAASLPIALARLLRKLADRAVDRTTTGLLDDGQERVGRRAEERREFSLIGRVQLREELEFAVVETGELGGAV
ncbi:MAG: hypothetical protein AAFZ87_05080, partial [Planctomycetota bacterium]